MKYGGRCLSCGVPLVEQDMYYHPKCAKRIFDSLHIPALNYTQDELNALAKDTVLSRISVPGVQPKLSLHLEHGNPRSNSRLTLVGLEGNYILKPQTPQWKHLPEAEHFCMLLARACGVSTAEFGLIPLKSGELAYITRRMDREGGRMLHMEDFCQILNKVTAQKYNGSMEQVGKALRKYSDAPGLDAVRLFELTVFCFLTGNSDMHLKNFSLLRKEKGACELSPAYDLVPVKIIMPADTEELALTLNGKKNRLKRVDFEKFAVSMNLTSVQSARALNRIVNSVTKDLPAALSASFLPEEMKTDIELLVSERILRIRQDGDCSGELEN